MDKRVDSRVDVGNTIVVAHRSGDWVSSRPDAPGGITRISICTIGPIDSTIGRTGSTIGGTGITIGGTGITIGGIGSTILIKRCEFLNCRC